MRCMGAKGSEVELVHSFQARQWYHVGLTLSSGSALTPGWARLYVDGVLEASERFKYPKVHHKAVLGRYTPCTWPSSHLVGFDQHGRPAPFTKTPLEGLRRCCS